MHGRVQNYGESCRILRRISTQHMRSVLPLVTAKNTVTVAGDRHCSVPSPVSTTRTIDSFFKDGRQISVGDCALFKPPQDCPPFIGLIRSLRLSKENNLLLGVNWLYRPAELKLGKGTLVDSAPNEIFYSFHKDETPAASLLHPCKVAFLPRDVELPTGASSFVCRRVYDIANKCLWWLTDQNFTNDRQEEVDQLLYTRTEMHETLQPDGSSPKQANGPNSTSQLKPALDCGQNSGTFPSQVKGKKREKIDHGSDPVKQGRSRTDGGDFPHLKSDRNLKSEIARITEQGGLVDLEGVDKLVQLMQPERTERKMDMVSRSILAGVMAATDKVDCLSRFVQLRGLPILDEWLQDIHKGKVGDGNSSVDSDRFVEEFILVLLRALDKLPVNLHALQMCNIGRSVNHLRSHKNLEIQRKARSLVDTWKKRVEAEMISIDAKSSSTQSAAAWSSKSRHPEASHGGSRTLSGSDVAIKSSITQNSASKTTSARSLHGENMKSATSSPRPGKPASSVPPAKESQPRKSIGDVPVIREDRSSSSNQSHNCSQSSSGKDEGKTSAAGSVAVSKMSNSSTRNRSSGFPISVTGSQKETGSVRSSSAHRTTASEKISRPGFCSADRVIEGPITGGSIHKLIVKIPIRMHSPAQDVGGGSLEDPAYMSSRASSPVLTDKQEQSDLNSQDKSDRHHNVASDVNEGLWQNNVKSVLTGSVDDFGLSAAPDEEHIMTIEDPRRSKGATPTHQWNSGKLHASFSPMNALIESCAKYSEANSSMSLEDDVGMNLLASVAAGEISRSNLVSPTDSTERSTRAVEEVCNGDEARSKSSPEVNMVGGQTEFCNNADCDENKQAAADDCSWPVDGINISKHGPVKISVDKICDPPNTSEEIPGGEIYAHIVSSNTYFRRETDTVMGTSDKANEKITSVILPRFGEKVRDGKSNEEICEKATACNISRDGIPNCKSDGFCATTAEEKTSIVMLSDNDKLTGEVAVSNHRGEGGFKSELKEELNMGTSSPQKSSSAVVKDEDPETGNNEKLQQTVHGQVEAGGGIKVAQPDEKDLKGCIKKFDTVNSDRGAADETHGVDTSSSDDIKNYHKKDNVKDNDILEDISVPTKGSFGFVNREAKEKAELRGSRSTCNHPDEAVQCATDDSSSTAEASDVKSKVKFDLNEVDEGKYGDSVNMLSAGASTVHLISSSPFYVNSIPSNHSASITVAAPAKGPFVPPEDLLRSKGELGWKGSATTSAFRPAEPRKVSETSLVSVNASPDASTSKHGRVPLDIDLNVPDERVLEEMAYLESALAIESTSDIVTNHAMLLSAAPSSVPVRSSSRLDFDLNTVDEANDIGHCSTSSNPKGEGSFLHVKPLGPLPTADVRRDFDLNSGPGVYDNTIKQFQIYQQMEGMPPQFSSAGFRMNSPVLGNISSWFLPGSTYSTVAVPSMLPDRGDQRFSNFPTGGPQRPIGPSGVNPFTSEIYRGSVLSSSPSMPLQSTPFQFPIFPFGATFPLPSATCQVGATSYADSVSGPRFFAPPVNPQFQGPVASASSQFQRPFKVNLPDNRSNDGLENIRKWGRQALDLNSGPGTMESEAREEMLPPPSGLHSLESSQALAEEHARMYSFSGGTLKRKEPEGSWENEFRYKQSS